MSISETIRHIENLEKAARRLEPGHATRRELLNRFVQYGQEFLDKLPNMNAYQESERNGAGLLDHPIPEEGREPEPLLDLLRTEVDTPGLNPASGGHLGYIPGGGVFPSALGDFLAAVTNRYAGVFFASPGAVRMENMLVRWMCSLIGYDETESGGVLLSGGSMANLTALVTARDHAGLKSADYPASVIYTTRHVHHCFGKALRIAGMKEAIVRHIPMDEHLRMRAEELEPQIRRDLKQGLRPFMIFASAGTTNAGAVDPVDELSPLAEKYELWLHVDAAYGGFFLLTEEGRKAIHGLDKADSVIMDPHKGLFLPYGSGALLVKNRRILFESQHYTADYMQDTFEADQEPSPADLSPELSRHFRGLRMWLPLQLFGMAPFRASLEEKIWLCRYFHKKISALSGFETGPEPELSITFFRYVPREGDADAFNRLLLKALHTDGRIFMSSTRIDGKFYIRLAACSFRTHKKEIDRALKLLLEKKAAVEQAFA